MKAHAWMVGLAALVGVIGTEAVADSISLKASVRLDGSSHAVRLADIATLDGAEAEALADLVVAERGAHDGAVEITLGEVRKRLETAGVHPGRVHLNGTTVIVRPTRTDVGAPAAMAGLSVELEPVTRAPRHEPVKRAASDIIDEESLRGAIARLIADGMAIDPVDLELTFDTLDRDVLDLDTHTNRFELQPLSSMRSDRLDIGVRLWSGGRVTGRHTITVIPMVQVDIVTLRHDVARGRTLTDDDLDTQARWISPGRASLTVPLVQAVGRVAADSLRAGDVLRRRSVKRETVLKRGDPVIVRCLVGGVVVSLQAEARGDGAEGDRIEFRKLGERENFTAVVSGPGEAVLDLSR